jgi:hypothetical protein
MLRSGLNVTTTCQLPDQSAPPCSRAHGRTRAFPARARLLPLFQTLIGGLSFLIVTLSGCSLPDYSAAIREDTLLDRAEQAFLDRDYQLSRQIFSQIAETGKSPVKTDTARYGLACIDMAVAKEPDAFDSAMTSFLQTIELNGHANINPELVLRAVSHGFALIQAQQKAAAANTARLIENGKTDKEKIQQMEQVIHMLQHQISVLENIEQERQEKRKIP